MKRILSGFFCVIFLACALSSCNSPMRDEKKFFAMGAFVSVTAYGGKIPEGFAATVTELESEISYKIDGSLIARANGGETVVLTEPLLEAILLCGELTEKTHGAFDLTVKSVSELWNFDNAPTSPPDDIALQAALTHVGWRDGVVLTENRLTLQNAELDLGAIGKGLACDYLIDKLGQNSLCGIVSVGGSIGVLAGEAKASYRIGIRMPFSQNSNELLGVIDLNEGFVSTSGTYEKCFTYEDVKYHHILNATTGKPENNGVVSVTVVAKTGVLSDALSTAAFLVGVEEGMRLCEEYGAKAIFVLENGSVTVSEGLRNSFLCYGENEVTYR